MADVLAFGRWEACRLSGNPYIDGVEKVYLTNPELAIMRDRLGKRMGLVVNRKKGTDIFFLPKGKPLGVTPIYYAIYSPIEQWFYNSNGYAPLPESDALQLVHQLIPEHVSLLAKSEDEDVFNHFPLSYRQMILHAARLENITSREYVESRLPENSQDLASKAFRLDTPADQ
ncbi:MAG: hypothetical protein H9W81_04275 [Enterococcus sp.]|nr:hypothetical protein [Enterococcus sp.]